jgi:hypothetical protein
LLPTGIIERQVFVVFVAFFPLFFHFLFPIA